MTPARKPQGELAACREQVSQLQTCFKITSLLNSELDLDRLLHTIISTARRVMKADIAALALIDPAQGDLVFQIALGKGRDHLRSLGRWRRVKLGDGIHGSVAKTGKPILIQDVHQHPTFDTQYEKLTGMAFGAMLCAPVTARGEVLGSCSVIHEASKGKSLQPQELTLFQLFCDHAGLAIQNARAHQALLENQRLEQDIAFSRSVQDGFLPATVPKHPGFDFAAQTFPARKVGGDYYDFIPVAANEVALLLGDVSGKGFGAALHMARLMSDIRYVSQNVREPCEVLNAVNRLLCARPGRRGMFTTVIYGVLNLKTGCLRAANAGHPSFLLRTPRGRILSPCPASGPPLGVTGGVHYSQVEINLKKGNRALLFSDGVIEAQGVRQKAFGMARLRKLFRHHPGTSRALVRALKKAVGEFTGNAPLFDDLTLLTFQLK
ncbi:MAG: PP2C family protein-serine/threonine phosphatase [Nitrospinaceae bacterium]